MRNTAIFLVVLAAWGLIPSAVLASTDDDEGAKKRQEQEVAASFADMANQVAVGETIFVTDLAGNEVKGKLLAYPEDTAYIRLMADDGEIDLSQDQVRQVDLQYKDSAWNGALIGMAVGGGGGALIGAAAGCDTEAMCVGAMAGLGAVTGLAAGGITDALMKARRPIYAKADQVASFQLRIMPVISKKERGVFVSIAF